MRAQDWSGKNSNHYLYVQYLCCHTFRGDLGMHRLIVEIGRLCLARCSLASLAGSTETTSDKQVDQHPIDLTCARPGTEYTCSDT